VIINYFIFIYCLIAGCMHLKYEKSIKYAPINIKKNFLKKCIKKWSKIVKKASRKYHISSSLINTIIYLESSGNQYAVSSSNAVGLMQIKGDCIGKQVYKMLKKKGQPSFLDLINPEKNIDIGSAYLYFLKHKVFYGVKDPIKLRYLMVLSYSLGTKPLLNAIKKSNKTVLSIINSMDAKSFLKYLKKNTFQYEKYIT